LVVSLAITAFLYSRVKRQFAKAATGQIVASATALEAGTQLKAEQLVLVEWPSSLALDGTFTKPEDVVGKILLYPVPPKEPIRNQLLAGPGAAIGLTAKIPDGMRAVAVVTNEVNNVSGFLFPGGHVDVLVTFRADQGKEPMTTTVLQNIDVLSTGEMLQPDPSGKPQNVKVVTLLLTPEDAQKLLLASTQGTVQFVLRNGADQAQEDHRPVFMRQLQGNASAATPAPATKVARTAAAAPKSSVYEVEIFDGTKKSVQKF
jgi:pilus assembly protein CpaB